MSSTQIIKVFSIPEHGKGEVDHVGGIAKTAVRAAIAAGEISMSSQDTVEFLCEKFVNKISPRYFFKDLTEESLQQCREANKLKTYTTIDGCSAFMIILFTPGSKNIKATPRLCICSECQKKFGSCLLFTTYELHVGCF